MAYIGPLAPYLRLEACSLLIETSPSNITPGSASVFTVWDANRQIHKRIWVSRESLKKEGLNISAPLFKAAAMADDLMRIVLVKIVQANPAKAPELAKRFGRSLHFSAKQCGLPESIYVTEDFVAFGVKKSLIGDGVNARVKKARTLDGKVVARRICDDADIMIDTLQKFQGNPWVIDLLGVCKYEKLSGEYRDVTFHSLYPQDLFDALLENLTVFTENTQLELADQLFKALQSLDGAHGDVKPNNILVDLEKRKLVLTDLDTYRSSKEMGKHYGGTPQWSAPEYFDGLDVVTNKLDVWPAGVILYYLFLEPAKREMPVLWQRVDQLRIRSCIQPKIIDHLLLKAAISDEKRTLLSHMIEIDVKKRWTIDEAAAYFREHILPGKKAPMDDQKG